MDEGSFREARILLEHAHVFIVEREHTPYWRGFEVQGRIVAQHDFTPTMRRVSDPDYQCIIEDMTPETELQSEIVTLVQSLHRCQVVTNPDLPPLDFDALFEELIRLRSLRPPAVPIQNQELASNHHVDQFIQVDRDDRKRRQKEIGRLWVKYGCDKLPQTIPPQ